MRFILNIAISHYISLNLHVFFQKRQLCEQSGQYLFNCFFSRLLTSDFACAAVLISFGAVLGKTSPLQLLVMAFLEIIIFQVNEYIGLSKFEVLQRQVYIHGHCYYVNIGITNRFVRNPKCENIFIRIKTLLTLLLSVPL